MLRRSTLAAAVLVLLFGAVGEAQTPPPAAGPAAPAPAKAVAKKPAAKPKAAAKPTASADSGPCQVGVIVATGDIFTVQEIGLTVFGNDLSQLPVKWGFDDLLFDRIRAAAAPMRVRRLPYARDAFDSFYHPKSTLFRNTQRELADLTKQIAGNAGCDSYAVMTSSKVQAQGTNQTLEGIGIVKWGSRSYLFAGLNFLVFDGATFEARRNPHIGLEASLQRMAKNFNKSPEHMRELENFKFPEPAAEAANNATLRDETRKFLAEYLDKFVPAYFKQQ